ncbi:uncharacterized protein LOC110431980 [Sorghum bicolor]|uniref:uncharacterized protein LOC110431980 n=1 Tax=Sorghum bicolor TaxID=4558 RepID=UPI000B4257DF|nr:uncharacterized protein LOC110431980 [Sorghum bicolor]|eukprot:XP_021307541.1 uncharacterized protein LOC110431980 [Sorghum bicolor]
MLIDDTTPTTSSNDWRTPFIKYLSDGSEFQDKTENERLIRRSRNYILVDGKLMRKNASSEVLLKCISQDDGVKLLDDIHAGSCGNHAASRTLVEKAFRAGFYWPTAVADTEKLLLASLASILQRTSTLLLEPLPFFSEAPNLLL